MRLIGEALPDVVLLDADMPGMGGFEVLAQIKSSEVTRDLPVIIMTGFASESHEKAGLELGAADFIAKPFRPSIVLARMRTQLHLKRISDQLKALSATDRLNLDHALVELQSRNTQLTQTSDRLELVNQGLLQFIHAASHDLREPLNTVTQFAGLLLEEPSQPLEYQDVQHLQRIARAGERMKGLLDDTVVYARLLDDTPCVLESVDLNLVIQKVLNALEAPIDEANLTISCSDMPLVQTTEVQISQVVQVLVLNAICYAHPQRPPSLHISASFNDGHTNIVSRQWDRYRRFPVGTGV